MARSHTPLEISLRAAPAFAFLTVLAWGGARPAQAAAPGYEVQLGVAESDNIQRLPSGGNSETIAYEELDFTWHDKRPLFDADVDADLSHLSYLNRTYGDEFIGNFIGSSKINLAADLLSWDIADNFGQARLDPLAPVTPANRENINYLTTGPVLTLPLGRTLQLDVTGQYGKVDYQKTPLDSTRLTGGVGLVHEVSPSTNISINAKDERIEFVDNQLNPDYDRQEAFFRFETSGSRTQIGLNLGYGRLKLLGAQDGIFSGHLDLTRRVSPNSTIGLALGHDYSDGADSFLLIQTAGGVTLNTQSAIEAGTPFVTSYATLAWNFQRERTTLALSASYFQDHYQAAEGLDNDLTMFNARVGRQMSPMLLLALTEYVLREQVTGGGNSATESNTGLQLTWRAGKSLSVSFGYYLAKGISEIEADKFTENRVWLSVGYGRAAEVPPGPAPVRLPGHQ